MPTDIDDDAYHGVLAELARLSEAWRIHREVVNRAIGYLNQEVIGFRDRLDKDDEARERRQKQVDAALENIAHGQTKIQRWQLARLLIEVLAVVVCIAYLYGLSR